MTKAEIYKTQIRVRLTRISNNVKTGPMPVSTTSSETCWNGCPMKGKGCYASYGNLLRVWKKTDEGGQEFGWDQFLLNVRALPKNQLWRHNQAGDLPGKDGEINKGMLKALTAANTGRKGFTYTHKPMTRKDNRECVKTANAAGFTINLSADNLKEADELYDLKIGPVVVVLPESQITNLTTPKGRKVVICPYTTHGVQCLSCGLCAKDQRTCIVGFPAHGTGKRSVSLMAAIV